MKEIERRIYVSEEIFNNEYSYVYGENKDKEVTFSELFRSTCFCKVQSKRQEI